MELVKTSFLVKTVYDIDFDISYSYICDYTVLYVIYLCDISFRKAENEVKKIIISIWLAKGQNDNCAKFILCLYVCFIIYK